jgi:hypothetical protein
MADIPLLNNCTVQKNGCVAFFILEEIFSVPVPCTGIDFENLSNLLPVQVMVNRYRYATGGVCTGTTVNSFDMKITDQNKIIYF